MEIVAGPISFTIGTWALFVLFLILFISTRFLKKKKELQIFENEQKNTCPYEAVSEIKTPNTVLIFSVNGPILSSAQGIPRIAQQFSTFGDKVELALRAVAKNPNVIGAIARFNTPCGTILGSASIGRGIVAFKNAGKIIIAYVGEISASGGVWAMVSACHISADPHVLTGNIGVVGPTLHHYKDVTSLGSGLLVPPSRHGRSILTFSSLEKEKHLGTRLQNGIRRQNSRFREFLLGAKNNFVSMSLTLEEFLSRNSKRSGLLYSTLQKRLSLNLSTGLPPSVKRKWRSP